jgi:hypothetical protein
MNRITIPIISVTLAAILLMAACAACSYREPDGRRNLESPGPRPGLARNFVKYEYSGRNSTTRAILFSEGAVRLDFIEGGETQTVLVCSNRPEIMRLLGAIDAMIQSPAAYQWWNKPDAAWLPTIHYKYADRNAAVRIPTEQLGNRVDALWAGVEREIMVVSMLELGESIVLHYQGDVHLKNYERALAIPAYDESLAKFNSWGIARVHRYFDKMIWEPEVGVYYDYSLGDGSYLHAPVVPHNYQKLPGMTEQIAVNYLQHGWTGYTEGVNITRSGNVCRVGFTHGKENWGIDANAISDDMAGAMLAWKDEADTEPQITMPTRLRER